ncbi:MAG TPA: hypothetical protein H9950_07575 [Candidatus Bacteroides avicola]|uniref:Uncharacterized protein n=1 Tax=Candidatus Bacteroides avicola TaxID=2838468 RepID=A0A9D2HY63_9BACE|nr:hypothetical protein [Candidatus Phocaeicola gallistercoris]HJA86032.1 hypothetical protein [Candidatus Bacteroides avicola]
MTNFATGVSFNLLKVDFQAILEKSDTGTRALVLPTKADNPPTVSLGEITDEFKKALNIDGADANIKEKINAVKKEGKSINPDEIKFQLAAAFLYIEMPNEPKKEEPKNEDSKTTTEYALAINVDLQDALPDFGAFKLNSVFIAVWNTKRKAVLKNIGAGEITEMLKLLEA